MEQIFLGEYIKRRRRDLKLTQAQLCEGICESMTVSRLERGKQAPSYHTVNALLQRLGLPGNRYFALLSKNEAEIDALKKEINADEISFERAAEEDRPQIREQTMAKIEALERLTTPHDRITRQYILEVRSALGGPEGSYSLEKRRDMLLEAIRLTVPRFDLEHIGLFRYSMEETTIINQIARTYSMAGQKKEALNIYCQLLQYIEKHDQELAGFAGHYCMVAHNYAINLGLEKQYPEAVKVAQKGRRVCTKYGNYQFLAGFLAILAESYYFIGDTKQSTEFYLQTYCIYDAVGDDRNLEIMRREMQERLSIQPPY